VELRPPILWVPFTLQPLRTLLVAHDDVHSQAIRRVLAESATARFEVEHASSGWEAQRLVAAGTYAALVLDDSLSDVDGETLLGRLRALGVVAPALFVTSTDNDQLPAAADDYLPKADVLTGNSLDPTSKTLLVNRCGRAPSSGR
jgi:CheY-like chemotaxis protein